MPFIDNELYSPPAACDALGEKGPKEATLAKWRSTGAGPPFIRVGRKIFYKGRAWNDWLASRTVTHTQQPIAEPVGSRRRR